MLHTLSRAHGRPLINPSLVPFLSPSSSFSSSSPLSTAPPGNGDASADPQPPPESTPPASFSSKDMKASLNQQEEKRWAQNPTQVSPNSPLSRNPAAGPYPVQTTGRDLQDIRKFLSEYRRRSSAPPPDLKSAPQGQQQQRHQISIQKLYERNLSAQGDRDGGVQSGFPGANPAVSGLSALQRTIASLKSSGKRADFDNRWADSTRRVPLGGGTVGGSPQPRLGWGSDLTNEYAYKELGEELKKLRPVQKQGQKGWFSLQELSERLSKLQELEKEAGKGLFKDVKHSLMWLQSAQEEKDKVLPRHRVSVLSQLGGTPDYLLMPPKEHLVEKYFHPDNMCSQEKMKLELAKVREEFKMSESDCGSARVQVALLTTKIKHLSSVLHKKDKHSRKGLQEMVQKRKKLLKYLRRTDWDSYCIVLSKLGLRDNPDYKNL